MDQVLWAPSHWPLPVGLALGESKGWHQVWAGGGVLGTVKRACSFWVGMRGRIQVPLVPPTNQFGGPYLGSQRRNQVRLPSGLLTCLNT